jgi:hypothetical protein
MTTTVSRLRATALGAAIFLAAPWPANAFGLTAEDFAFLTSHELDRNSPLIVNLSPKEQSRLHALITDLATAKNPVARARDVSEALAAFRKNQLWEQDNPGRLWDAPKR